VRAVEERCSQRLDVPALLAPTSCCRVLPPAKTYCCHLLACLQGFKLMSLDQRRRYFFKYEKRIRELSPPEKVGPRAGHVSPLALHFNGNPSAVQACRSASRNPNTRC